MPRCVRRYKITGVGTVAGCYVTDGKIARNAQVRLLRDNVVIARRQDRFPASASRTTPRKWPRATNAASALESYNDIKENDVIECFLMEEIEQ